MIKPITMVKKNNNPTKPKRKSTRGFGYELKTFWKALQK
jgi:hypothetical protein